MRQHIHIGLTDDVSNESGSLIVRVLVGQQL